MYIINIIYISQKEIQQEEDYEKTVEEKLWEEAGMETKEWLKETVCEKPKEKVAQHVSASRVHKPYTPTSAQIQPQAYNPVSPKDELNAAVRVKDLND